MVPRDLSPRSARPRRRVGVARTLLALLGASALCAAPARADPPPNDEFASAVDLGSASFDVNGSIAEATAETGEPTIGLGATVWYRWTPPHDGRFRVTTEGSSALSGVDTTLSILVGTAVDALTVVGSNNDAVGTDSLVEFSGVSGTAYRIQVGAVAAGTGAFRVALAEVATPGNDAFASATDVGPAGFETTGSVVGATAETGEPRLGAGTTVWYRWTAPTSGFVVISTQGSAALGGIDTTLGVYTGDAVNALTEVASNDDGAGVDSRVSFRATPTIAYLIQVDAKVAGDGRFKLSLSQPASPTNDAFANAAILSGADFGTGGLSSNATREPGEPDTNGLGDGQSLWYRWTAPVAGTVTVTTKGSAGPAPLGVYTGDAANALTRLGADATTVAFAATAGAAYLIAVDPPVGTTDGFVLNGYSPPPNDARVFASPLLGRSAVFRGHVFGATTEAGEPSIGPGGAGTTVWYAWAPPNTGPARVRITTSTFSTLVAVFNAVDAPAPVAQGTDSATFEAVAGTAYLIGVDAASGGPGTFAGGVAVGASNDAFADRMLIPSAPVGRVAGSNVGATTEPGEPLHSALPGATEASVWWSWTAPQDGQVTIDTAGSTFETVVAVYTGSVVSSLSRVATSGLGAEASVGGGRVTFEATAGVAYAVAVTGARGAEGEIVWSVLPGSLPPSPPLQALATRLTATLNFRTAARDTLTLVATLPAPKGAVFANSVVTVDVGGVVRTFTLNARSVGRTGFDTLSIRGAPTANRVLVMHVARADLRVQLASFGFTDRDALQDPATVPVTIVAGGVEYRAQRQDFYTAKAGRSGVAR